MGFRWKCVLRHCEMFSQEAAARGRGRRGGRPGAERRRRAPASARTRPLRTAQPAPRQAPPRTWIGEGSGREGRRPRRGTRRRAPRSGRAARPRGPRSRPPRQSEAAAPEQGHEPRRSRRGRKTPSASAASGTPPTGMRQERIFSRSSRNGCILRRRAASLPRNCTRRVITVKPPSTFFLLPCILTDFVYSA